MVAKPHQGKLVFKNVTACISRKEEPVSLIDLVRQFEVQIVKIELIVTDFLFFGQGRNRSA